MLTPFLSILAALVDGGDAAKASLSELRQRLGATPAVPAIGPGRLAGLAAQYGQPVVDALVARIRKAGLDPFEDADLARIRAVLPFLARTIARPEDSSGAYFGPEVTIDLLDLAAASAGRDLLATPWLEVLRQLHQDQAAAVRHLEAIAAEQQFTPTPDDPVQARVLDWLRRLSLSQSLPYPAPNIEWITDWVRGAELPPGALEVYGPEGAIAASAAWHHEPSTDLEAWTTWRTRVDNAKARGWRPSEGVPVRRWDNGWTLQSIGPTQLKDESEIMNHCVGDANQNYTRDVTQNTAEIWSLRNPEGYPVATMEVRRSSGGGDVTLRGGPARVLSIPQVRGPSNRTMHPSHRRYLWDTFRDHLDLLPNSVQQEILQQFLHRGTADFHRFVLGSPKRAFEWAANIDKRSLPDTREAALQDPDTAVRWMEVLDRRVAAADTLAAAEKNERALARYFDVVKKDEASPSLRLLIDTVRTATEGAELRARLHGDGVRHLLDERFVDDPRYLSRIFALDPKLSPETWVRLGLSPRYLDPKTKEDADAAEDAKSELTKALVLRDPYATLRASVASGQRRTGDTPERQAAVLHDAIAAAIYHNLHHPYRDEAYPFWYAIAHAPIGPIPDPAFLTDVRAHSGGFNSAYLVGAYAPKTPTTRAQAALSAVLHAREHGSALDPEGRARIQPLVDLALSVGPDEIPEAQALLYVLWPELLADPAHRARLETPSVLLALGKVVDSDRTRNVAPELTAYFRPGAPLRKIALRIATRRPTTLPADRFAQAALLSFLALHVDQTLRPDVVRLFFQNDDLSALGHLLPLLLDGASGLSPAQRRAIAPMLPHPHQFPGYAWTGNVPASGRGKNSVEPQDVAGLWQGRWITAQIADRIAALRTKTRTRPMAERRAVEEAIEHVANSYRVGQAQSRANGWGFRATPGAFGDPKMTSALSEFRAMLAKYRLPDLRSIDGGLDRKGRYSETSTTSWPSAAEASEGKLPDVLYYGLTGDPTSAHVTLVAPKLSERTLYNGPAFGDAPYSLHGGLRADSPELLAWIENADRVSPPGKMGFSAWTGIAAYPGLPRAIDKLRVLFLAATPEDAEIATEAAVIVPIQTKELPICGWVPWTTPAGAAGWMLLFAPSREDGQVSFKARLGAMTRTAPRADPE